MGDVQHFETDLAWAGLFYLEERLPYYDIIYPYLFDRVCFLVIIFTLMKDLKVPTSREHPRCANAHTCLEPTIARQ